MDDAHALSIFFWLGVDMLAIIVVVVDDDVAMPVGTEQTCRTTIGVILPMVVASRRLILTSIG